MSSCKKDHYCKCFDKDVIVAVFYKNVVMLGGSGAVPTGIKCSGSPNGQCGKNNICPVLKKAENEVPYGNL